MADLSNWLTREETARRLNTSERHLNRLVARDKGPERKLRPRPGMKPEPVYNPADIEALAAAMNPPFQPAVDSPLNLLPARREDVAVPRSLETILTVIERLAAFSRPALPPGAKTFVTIAEAAETTGLSEFRIRKLIRSGQLPFIADGEWKIHRDDLTDLHHLVKAEIIPVRKRKPKKEAAAT